MSIGPAVVLALALGYAAPASAAQQKPEVAQKSAGGIIRGTVTAADTGKPLRRARVTIVRAGEGRPGSPILANTNSLGNFEARNVPEGSYLVSATRAGYLPVEYGQRYPRERGSTVDVRGETLVNRIDLALPRGGVLAGRITDEQGEPFPGVDVTALEMRYREGRRQPLPTSVSTTDDGGYFRISGLPPGVYQLVARSQEMWRNDKKETYGYASTYFPGGGPAEAQAIALAPSQQQTDVQFSLEVSRTARIAGRVQLPTGEPASGRQVHLGYYHGGYVMPSGRASTRTTDDGTFEMQDVPPGVYSVASGSAFTLVTISAADVSGITLVPRVGSAVSGTVVTEEGSAPPFSASGVRLFLVAAVEDDRVLPTVRLPAVNSDWSFSLSNVGGPFLFRIRGLPDDWMLSAVRLNEKDITDTPWNVPAGSSEIRGLTLVLTPRIGRVSGTVIDGEGKPTAAGTVVLFSDDKEHWTVGSRFVRMTRPDASGRFTVAGLPAGTYRAIAQPFIESGQWEDPAFLEDMRAEAYRFMLGDGSSQSVTLKLRSAR